jgi:hypothetical protein
VTPSAFPEANAVLRRPEGMTEAECGDLHVHRTGEAFISMWTPTPEERAAIAAGAPIYLWVFGSGHPPVAVETFNPFKAKDA